ncbi:ATP-binding protein [Streptomyces sp. NPDC017940]|uniref:ATP-binding protein n=1 Tax=Streptomyces sp. NPDC017940 TaxID=3365017 RepID=UPI003787FEFE
MDPMNRGPEEYGHDGDDREDARIGREGTDDDSTAREPRTPPDAAPPPAGQSAPATADFGPPAIARTVRVISGDLLLTVNPVDGSEIEPCPPGERPARPRKRTAAERAEHRRAALPPVPPGPALPRLPLLERQEERERLARLLARGRSVRLTGPAGSGRTALLAAVAEDCADLAPDGVIRLSGYHRTVNDLLYDLFAAVHDAPLHRPDRTALRELLAGIGAVVVLDDLEFGGAALEELLAATPECAFLVSATPDVPAPSPDSHLEEVLLGGIGRGSSIELLERVVGRVLSDDEANWAGDLWFESEGLPLRFVQAGALLRQCDRLRADPGAFDAYGHGTGPDGAAAFDAPFGAAGGTEVPLPSLADGAAPAALLASRLSASARAALRFAVALGGELPHPAHLPALVGDTHADAALCELVDCALVTPAGGHYRLAAGVRAQLESAGYADDAAANVQSAAQHYAWWSGHPSVGPERVAAEADAVLATLTALTNGPAASGTDGGPGEPSAAVLLARTVAPAFAGGLHWGAWERALRCGQGASRTSGEVAEEAYFHHELGILALCTGLLDRARAELEASIGLRGALADKRGMIAGRRALALVADCSGGLLSGDRSAAGEEVPDARYEESASPPGGVPTAFALPAPPPEADTVVTHRAAPAAGTGAAHSAPRRSILRGTRRNLVAVAAGALLVAVLGTVVTLGATSDDGGGGPAERVRTGQSASADDESGGPGTDEPGDDSAARPSDPGEDGVVGTSDDPKPSTSGRPASSDDAKGPSGKPSGKPSGRPSDKPTEPTDRPTEPTDKPTKPTKPPTKPPTTPPPTPTTPPPTPTTPPPTPTTTPPSPPDTSNSASDPAASSPVAGVPTRVGPGTPGGPGGGSGSARMI